MNLPSNAARCLGDYGLHPQTKCATCARRLQLQRDDPAHWFPLMPAMPQADGSCIYWIEGPRREDVE